MELILAAQRRRLRSFDLLPRIPRYALRVTREVSYPRQ